MNKLNERLTLIANLSVVVGIIFLAFELQQNTQAIQAQTRDSLTEKQMEFAGWIATNPETATAYALGNNLGVAEIGPPGGMMYTLLVLGNFREWENSHYQYERGLFTAEEFGARTERWVRNMTNFIGYREIWASNREHYSPSFRAEIDRIVAEVGG